MWHLADPKALWLGLIPLALAFYFLTKQRSAKLKTLLPLSGPRSLLQAQSRRAKWAFRILFALSLIAFLNLVLVIARPIRSEFWKHKQSDGIDIVILLDVSESMDATDLLPTRILSAKQVIRDFIHKRTEDRIGFVIFGGEAVMKSPLTRDYDFLLSQVEDIKLRELKQGTAIGMGLANAVSRLRHSTAKSRVIILLTDGDSNVGAINPITATHLAKQEGIRIYSIGIGRSDRVVVPIYAYDMMGNKSQLIAQVPSYLNPELLKEISRLTGGKAYMARDSGMLGRILHEIDSLEKSKIKVSTVEKRTEEFHFPAGVAIALLALVYFLEETRYRKARRVAPV